MHFVVLGVHSPEICPLSNAKTKALLLEIGPQIPDIAKQHGVDIVAGPFVNREHTTVVIVETERADALDAFLAASRLHQWNQLRILPSLPMEEGMRDLQDSTSLF
jgi:hypothetical protein